MEFPSGNILELIQCQKTKMPEPILDLVDVKVTGSGYTITGCGEGGLVPLQEGSERERIIKLSRYLLRVLENCSPGSIPWLTLMKLELGVTGGLNDGIHSTGESQLGGTQPCAPSSRCLGFWSKAETNGGTALALCARAKIGKCCIFWLNSVHSFTADSSSRLSETWTKLKPSDP